jgi:serpin B
MESVLSIEQDNDSFHQYMKSLYEYLNENDDYNVSTANALWVRENFELLEEYINVIETYYGGSSSEVDYSNPEEASEIINQWVENQTNNLIKNLVPPSAIDPLLTMLILTNAIYFKGTWQVQFDEANTTDKDFTLSDGETIQVETMILNGTENTFNYSETDDLQILELPYTGNDISMMILLPKDGVEITDVISSIDKDSYDEWIDSMTGTEVDIYIPKFKFETQYALNDYLIDLGMQKSFSFEADFSGIDGRPDLFIDAVLHKAFIEVNEEGTEAAAATAVIMTLKSVNGGETPIVFNADHPFLFTIHHKETNTILFLGSVNNPLTED